MTEEIQQLITEFERGRNQLMMTGSQKQQLTIQKQTIELALEELNKSKEKNVLKAVGNILITKDRTETITELEKQKETAELKLKTVEKQEKILTDKLNKLKKQIEEKNEKK
jgi:prefoldin beta subunit